MRTRIVPGHEKMLITTDKVVRLRLTDGSEIVIERLPRGRLGVSAPQDVLIDTENEVLKAVQLHCNHSYDGPFFSGTNAFYQCRYCGKRTKT